MARTNATSAVIALLLAACGHAAPSSDDATQAVVDGEPESGYPAVGYLLNTAASSRPSCTVTLIAPDAVLTAAHCIHETDPRRYMVGFGAWNDAAGVRRNAAAVVVYPDFRALPVTDWNDDYSWHDLAIVKLEMPVTDRAPAVIARTETTCGHRYIGYGRTTRGEDSAYGTTGERKSTRVCASGQNEEEILISGERGGVCYGDSGGPLMIDGTNRIVGVLSHTAPAYAGLGCGTGYQAVMTKVTAFVESFIRPNVPNIVVAPLPSDRPAIDACVIDGPEQVRVRAGEAVPHLAARVSIEGRTLVAGATRGVRGEIGVGATGTLPADGHWNWFAAEYDFDQDGDDRWSGAFRTRAVGRFDVAYRFTADDGRTYAYCDRRYALREYDPANAVRLQVDPP